MAPPVVLIDMNPHLLHHPQPPRIIALCRVTGVSTPITLATAPDLNNLQRPPLTDAYPVFSTDSNEGVFLNLVLLQFPLLLKHPGPNKRLHAGLVPAVTQHQHTTSQMLTRTLGVRPTAHTVR